MQVAECLRRLALASVIGIVSSDSSAAPVLGLLLCLFFNHTFTFRPFKNPDDSVLGIILAYALTLFFLAALMIKADLTGDSEEDQRTFGALLVAVLASGPTAIALQTVFTAAKLSGSKLTAPTLSQRNQVSDGEPAPAPIEGGNLGDEPLPPLKSPKTVLVRPEALGVRLGTSI